MLRLPSNFCQARCPSAFAVNYTLLKKSGALQEGVSTPFAESNTTSAMDLLAMGEIESGTSVAGFSQIHDLSHRSIPRQLIELLPESVARENCVIAVESNGERVTLAAVNRDDLALADKLRFILGVDIAFVKAPAKDILRAIDRHYGPAQTESVDSMLCEFTETAIDFDEADEGDVETHSTTTWRGTVPASRHLGFGRSLTDVSSRPAMRPRTISPHEGQGMWYYVVPEGERALVRHTNGRMEIITGPQRLWRGWKVIVPMERCVAHPGEFLIVRFLNGKQEHHAGPIQIWRDPREHASIEKRECLQLAAKEAVVVYRNELATGVDRATSRRIVYGPTQFFPQPGEWLHTFSWHASKGGSKGIEKVPNGLVFQKLWLMPDQMYHDVPDVRTGDGAVLTIRLMIFFELADIERMLDNTHDPIGDFVNAATADVVEFVGKLDFEAFKNQTDKLNEVATYRQLLGRASQAGYRITNVVYRGYGAADSLQQMHNQAIEARTKLQLERETEQQAQQLEDYKLQSQLARTGQRRSEQLNEARHTMVLAQEKSVAALDVRRQQAEFLRQKKLDDARTDDAATRIIQGAQIEHLRAISEMGVDLTRYLTQSRADRVIEFRNSNGTSPQVHLNASTLDETASD